MVLQGKVGWFNVAETTNKKLPKSLNGWKAEQSATISCQQSLLIIKTYVHHLVKQFVGSRLMANNKPGAKRGKLRGWKLCISSPVCDELSLDVAHVYALTCIRPVATSIITQTLVKCHHTFEYLVLSAVSWSTEITLM